jgi:RNA polymerase sigma-70 factor, ECF subfamily
MRASDEFTRLTGQFRRELIAHCYQMLGSADEAEDVVQETYLRAWRSYEDFEGRSSVRTWLYRIATNACHTAIERRGRRPLPAGLGTSSNGHEVPRTTELLASSLLRFRGTIAATEGEDPALVAESRASIRLTLGVALRCLSARQRTVLILRDVLEWPATDVACRLGMTTMAVNSTLRRARIRLARELPEQAELAEPTEPELRALLERFAAAVENADAKALTELLQTMPS